MLRSTPNISKSSVAASFEPMGCLPGAAGISNEKLTRINLWMAACIKSRCLDAVATVSCSWMSAAIAEATLSEGVTGVGTGIVFAEEDRSGGADGC